MNSDFDPIDDRVDDPQAEEKLESAPGQSPIRDAAGSDDPFNRDFLQQLNSFLEQFFTQLFTAFARRAARLMRRHPDDPDVSNLVSDVLFTAAARAVSGEPIRNPKAYVTVMLSRAIRDWRKQLVRQSNDSLASSTSHSNPFTLDESSLEKSETRLVLQRRIGLVFSQMARREDELILRETYVNNVQDSVLAKKLKIKKPALRQRRSRARNEFLEIWHRLFGSHLEP